MTRSDIIKKVKVKLEEFSNFENQSYVLPANDMMKPIDSYIEETMDEATREVLLILPLWFVSSMVRDGAAPITIVADGYGTHAEMNLPQDFLRLVAVKLKSWRREVNDGLNLISHTHPRYKEQQNPATRGRIDKPVGVLTGNKIELYSAADATDVLEYFIYIPTLKAEQVEDHIIEYVILNTAAKVMGIYGKIDGMKLLQEQLAQSIKMIAR